MIDIFLRKFCLTICCLLFLKTPFVLAHVPHDDIHEVAISPMYNQDQTLFIIVRNRLFKSKNGGKSWVRLVKGLDNKGFLSALAISPETKNVLYVTSTGDGVYKSLDAGISWVKVNNNLDERELDLLVVSPGSTEFVLAAGKKGGLYKTVDGGENWHQTMSKDTKITTAQFLPGKEHSIVVGDDKGTLYSSEDLGKTWKEVFKSKFCGAITTIAVSPEFLKDHTYLLGTEKGGIFRTSDNGVSFKQLGGGEGEMTVRNISDIDFLHEKNTKRPAIIVSAWHRGIFISIDNGWSWTEYSEGLTRDLQADRPQFNALVEGSYISRPHFSNLEVSNDFTKDKTIFLAGFNGLFRSTNGGKTWEELNTITRTVIGIAISPDYKNDQTIAAATYTDGVYISYDAGKNWRLISKDLRYVGDKRHHFKVGPSERRVSLQWLRLYGIMFSPNYSFDKAIYFTPLAHLVKLLCYMPDKFFKTTFSASPISAMGVAFSPDFSKDNTMYMASEAGNIWLSEDKGRTFKQIGLIGKSFGYTSTYFCISPNFSSDKTLFYTANDKSLYKSVDGGYNWFSLVEKTPIEDLSRKKIVLSPDYGIDKTVILGTGEGIYISENGGESWSLPESPKEVREGLVEAIAVSPNYSTDGTIFLSLAGKGLFVSKDRARNFISTGDDTISLSRVDMPSTSMPIQLSPNYEEDKTIYGYGAAGAEIYKSDDEGKTWKVISIPEPARNIFDVIQDNFIIFKYKSEPILKTLRKKARSKRFLALLIGCGFVLLLFLRFLQLNRRT